MTWSITVSGLGSANGSVILSLANNTGIDDLAGNALSTSTFTGQTYIIETTAPTLNSINLFSPAGEYTNDSSVTYLATFSDAVTGVTASNFSVSGTANGSLTADPSDAAAAGLLSLNIESKAGCRLRLSLGRYLGASTAAPPITTTGINAASNTAMPAIIPSPTVTSRIALFAESAKTWCPQ